MAKAVCNHLPMRPFGGGRRRVVAGTGGDAHACPGGPALVVTALLALEWP